MIAGWNWKLAMKMRTRFASLLAIRCALAHDNVTHNDTAFASTQTMTPTQLGPVSCPFVYDSQVCPAGPPSTGGLGSQCYVDPSKSPANTPICEAGTFCRASQLGQPDPVLGYTSWSGTCETGPRISDVYQSGCNPSAPWTCVFRDELALSPYAPPAVLQCVPDSAAPQGFAAVCRLKPNVHGDACHVNGECASGHCLKEIKLCRGIAPGEACVPGSPSQCGTFGGVGHYCQPNPNSIRGGICTPTIAPGKLCQFASQCQRGYFCARPVPSFPSGTCMAPFTVPTGANTTIGPFMCAAANGVLLQAGRTERESTYACVDSADTAATVGSPCAGPGAAPPGYSCQCAQDGVMRLATAKLLGLGMRSTAWTSLYACLVAATNIMGEPCEFGWQDMTTLRYGSCAYYACYPFYQQLVNATGSRYISAPLAQFQPLSVCEVRAAKQFYVDVFVAPCATLTGLDAWRCAVIHAEALSVATTNALISVIFIVLGALYWAHMYLFRRQNGTVFNGLLPQVQKLTLAD